jgi:beta-mannosidase
MHVMSVREAAGQFPSNQHFFTPVKDLIRTDPRAPQIAMARIDPCTIAITLTAADYLYFVHILSDDEHVSFDDNYFSLRAGETRVITATHPVGMPDPAALSVRWR